MTDLPEWFCTKCKHKFESDIDHPHCQRCGSGYVLNNRPTPPLLAKET